MIMQLSFFSRTVKPSESKQAAAAFHIDLGLKHRDCGAAAAAADDDATAPPFRLPAPPSQEQHLHMRPYHLPPPPTPTYRNMCEPLTDIRTVGGPLCTNHRVRGSEEEGRSGDGERGRG